MPRDISRKGEAIGRLEPRLSGFNLLLLGIGAIIGAGIFVMTGTAAAHYAGPAIAISFAIAAVACLCTGLCYAELASLFPESGGAYSYARASLGPYVGWVVGWCLLLEYLFAAGAVAVGWSGYFIAACADLGWTFPKAFAGAPLTSVGGNVQPAPGSYINLPAATIVLLLTACAIRSVRASAFVNNFVVAAKVIVIALFLIVGAQYVDPTNWHPFVPENTGEFGHFGWSGVLRGAGVVFFAYLGFDAVATAAQEARNPQRDIPRAIIGALVICTALYVLMALVMTGLTSYENLSVPHPVSVAIRNAGSASRWLGPLVNVGVLAGLTSVILALLYAQSRVLYAVSCDGLLPPAFAKVHPRFRTPSGSILLVGALAAVLGALMPLEVIGTLVSVGTLFAFMVVCFTVLRLRRTRPEVYRKFRVPFFPWVPVGGILICAYLIVGLGGPVLLRFGLWLLAGSAVYLVYARRRGLLAISEELAGANRVACETRYRVIHTICLTIIYGVGFLWSCFSKLDQTVTGGVQMRELTARASHLRSNERARLAFVRRSREYGPGTCQIARISTKSAAARGGFTPISTNLQFKIAGARGVEMRVGTPVLNDGVARFHSTDPVAVDLRSIPWGRSSGLTLSLAVRWRHTMRRRVPSATSSPRSATD